VGEVSVAEAARLVTPLSCNEAQAAVLRSAMTRRLTVATGPPGTGKSQLVANLVATAVAADQRVLVASTNNQAVDEVWRRCDRLVPGSVVRTGSYQYRDVESAALNALRTAAAPERNPETARAQLDLDADELKGERERLADRARSERTLLRAGAAREEYAARLDLPVSELTARLASVRNPESLAAKAARAVSLRFLGEWRRGRQFINGLITARDAGGSDWSAVKVVLKTVRAAMR
jgi:hypothetical protein